MALPVPPGAQRLSGLGAYRPRAYLRAGAVERPGSDRSDICIFVDTTDRSRSSQRQHDLSHLIVTDPDGFKPVDH